MQMSKRTKELRSQTNNVPRDEDKGSLRALSSKHKYKRNFAKYIERSLCRLVLEKTITNPYKSSPGTFNRPTTAVPRLDISVDYLVCPAERKFPVRGKKGKKQRVKEGEKTKSEKVFYLGKSPLSVVFHLGVEEACCVNGRFYLKTWEGEGTGGGRGACIYGDKV